MLVGSSLAYSQQERGIPLGVAPIPEVLEQTQTQWEPVELCQAPPSTGQRRRF